MVKSTKGPIGNASRRTFTVDTAAVTRGYAVKRNADDHVVICVANDAALGIMEETTAVGVVGSVVLFGECIGICGAAVTQGDWLKSDGNGALITSGGEDIANVGRAMSSTANSGDEVLVFVMPVKKRS